MSSVSSTSSSSTDPTSLLNPTATPASQTAAALSQLIASSNTSSGLDDNTIINELVSIDEQPITALQTQSTAIQSQISQIAQISSALQSLATAAQALQTNGVVGLTAGANTGFTASAALGAQSGTYQIDVQALAIAAKTRSQGFSSTDTATGGTLNMTVQGVAYSVTIPDGSTLNAVSDAIASSGAPVSAAVISDGTDSYLSITDSESGFPPSGTAADALSMTFTPTGTQGQAIDFTAVTAAQNAQVTVDGLNVTSQSNTISSVIPGITLNLVSVDAAAETLNIQADTTTTASNLQTFVTAYNSVMSLVQAQLNVTASTDRTSTLAGDPAMTDLQQQLQNIFTSTISEASDINSLPAIGLTTSETDGSLSLDTSQLSAALAQDPNAVNALFGLSADSIAAITQNISNNFTEIGTGALAVDTDALQGEVTDIGNQVTDLQTQATAYQQQLVSEFSNMESIVAGLKSTSNYLTQQSDAAKSSS